MHFRREWSGTTRMNMLAGLFELTSGEIVVNGQVVKLDSPFQKPLVLNWDGSPTFYVG